ncbi:membrane-associated serine protease [Secundilactobacillus oryzae JCM 18671]|uniref:Membrane-associated serine protease n=2 Tax=Secundilactobacillus oryzae TaxID=1202668 RepID=A0A081BFZ1_9LACO|nr:membrane-associated serine protease [Secundilactobacillus oryzae JCM 18671]
MKRQFQKINNAPFVTYGLLGIMVVVYLLMTMMGGSTNPYVLIAFGAKVTNLIQAGEVWRLITPAFLHIGFEHILLNGITLYFLGVQIERIFGHWRYLVIFLVTALGGNVASFVFSPNSLSAGASTAIFGLFGAFLMLGESFWENPYIRQMTKTFALFIVLNLGFDLMSSGIDMAGHLGGLVSGFLVGYSVALPKHILGKVSTSKRIVATAVLIIGIVWLFRIGMTA